MRKIQVLFLVLFGLGVLLGGVGTGIALGEYSSMEYLGTVVLGEEHLETRTLQFDYSAKEGEKLVLAPVHWVLADPEAIRIREDEEAPMGSIFYDVTYDPRQLEPSLMLEDYADESTVEGEMSAAAAEAAEAEQAPSEEVKKSWLYLDVLYRGNDFDMAMEHKDRILQDLKEKKFASYSLPYITEITIRVNPEMLAYLEDHTRG